jgi:beta-1,4-mannooligosaccharide/beta-1,4-mannosyl-N-acetylglucosamine phosphorylase
MIGKLTSSPVLHRCAKNPVLTKADVPYESELAFNAGVVKYCGKYVMVFRNDFGAKEQGFADFAAGRRKDPPPLRVNLGIAYSDNGVDWKVAPKPCFAIDDLKGEITHAYDPRLTVIDGRVYMCFATNTKHGLRAGIAVTDDFEKFDILHLTVPDNRNMVLFPERIGGRYIRLERPFPVYSRGGKDRFDTWLSASPDLRYWGDSELVLAVEDVPFADDKIGPAAPPVRTEKGWLTTFHAVDRDDVNRGKNGWEKTWTKRYTGGIMLLDLADPSKVVGMSKQPLIAPEAPYETSGGYRNDVIFPGGMILEDSGEVKIYYGAADTVECLATADVDDLIRLCTEKR